MYEPQEGIWTLTAPDGRQWTGASGLLAAAAEQRERIPPEVQLKRIFAACELTQDELDAARYRWLRARHEDANLNDWHVMASPGEIASVDLDAEIDEAMTKTPNVEAQGREAGFSAKRPLERLRSALELYRGQIDNTGKICDGIMPSGLANARLMRAAPDLAGELRNMVEMFAGTDESPGQHEAVASARRLLAALALDA